MQKEVIGVLLADTHLDIDTIEINKSIWNQADELAQELKTEIYLLGDVYTSRKAQQLSVLNAFNEILDNLKSNVIAFPGNHDKVNLESEVSYLDSNKYHPKLEVIREYQTRLTKGVDLHLIPYFEEEKFISILSKIQTTTNSDFKNILLTHMSVSGVKNNDSSVVLNRIDQDLFQNFDLVCTGHYHNRSEVGTNIVYIGSAYQGNFGEDDGKGFTILYSDSTFEFVQAEFPKYTTIEINLDKTTIETVKQIHQRHENSDDFVRFVITGDDKKIKAFDKTKIEADGIKVVLKNIDVELEIERASRKEFVNFNKSNIGDQFKEFCIKEDLDYTHGNEYLKKQLA